MASKYIRIKDFNNDPQLLEYIVKKLIEQYRQWELEDANWIYIKVEK